jgi:hypothetical protein
VTYQVFIFAEQPMPDIVSQHYWYGPFGIPFAIWAIGLEHLSCMVQSVVLLDNGYSGVQPCLQYIFV